MKKLLITVLVLVASQAFCMEGVIIESPYDVQNGGVVVTIPDDLHHKLKFERIELDADGVVVGFTIFHKVGGTWVQITQKVVDGQLFMLTDGVQR